MTVAFLAELTDFLQFEQILLVSFFSFSALELEGMGRTSLYTVLLIIRMNEAEIEI